MPEKTKEALSEELNDLLGTAIDFTRLSKDDLVSLQVALIKVKESTAEFSLPILDRPLGEILDRKLGNKSVRETSLREILGLPKERKGIFGFGILVNRLRRPEAEEKKIEPTA